MVTALRVLAVLAALYLLIAVLAWRMQESLAFPAPRIRLPEPAELGIPDAQRVTVTTEDSLRLGGWYFPPIPAPRADAQAPGLLWFPGNMETVAALAPILVALKPPGTGLLAIDYRGYGENAGRPSETGIYRDAAAAWRWLSLRPELDPGRLAIYGRSVGSAPALWLAARERPVAVVLDAPFTSARAMAARHYWFLPRFLIRLDLDNLSRIGEIDAPVLVLHGTDDAIAPFTMGEALTRAAGDGHLLPIPGAGHNDTYTRGGAAYRDTLHAFLNKAFGRHAP